jgi:hypothetical protein
MVGEGEASDGGAYRWDKPSISIQCSLIVSERQRLLLSAGKLEATYANKGLQPQLADSVCRQAKPLTFAHHTHILAVLALGSHGAEGAARQLRLAALAAQTSQHDGQLAGWEDTTSSCLACLRQAQLPAHHASGSIAEATSAADCAPTPAYLDLQARGLRKVF